MFLTLTKRLLYDLELLLNGSFDPLTGFLNEDDYNSVVETLHLANGEFWPMPIVLPVSSAYENEDVIILRDPQHYPIAKLYVESFYKPDFKNECQKVYGTCDRNHPYVNLVYSWKTLYYVGGRVERINPLNEFSFRDLRYTPKELKNWFVNNDFTNVVAFQTRNPMHRCHMELTMNSLRDAGQNCLLIQPIVGCTQESDIDYATRIKCYKLLMKQYPPDIRVKLAILPLSMRMAGPREALWHAVIRRNYGASYFIIGRDHAGPSTTTFKGERFYGPYDAHKLVEKYEDELGITILFSKMITYVENLNRYVSMEHVRPSMKVNHISGTEFRKLLQTNQPIPEWFSYKEIADELRKRYTRGLCIYIVGLSASGKTTLATTLKSKLEEHTSRRITVLDGDVIRTNLSKGLGFSKQDRSDNVRRIGYVASLIVNHGGIVICSNIAPYDEDRSANRALISENGTYIEVFMNTPLNECETRDPKGLYAKARSGEIKQFTGISDVFEEPSKPEVVVSLSTPFEQTKQVFTYIEKYL
jgi:sulfate adenylyltransferase